ESPYRALVNSAPAIDGLHSGKFDRQPVLGIRLAHDQRLCAQWTRASGQHFQQLSLVVLDPASRCRAIDKDEGIAPDDLLLQFLAKLAWILARKLIAGAAPVKDVAEFKGQLAVCRLHIDKNKRIDRPCRGLRLQTVVKMAPNSAFEILYP